MAVNDLVPFATGAGANVVAPSPWKTTPVRQQGFQAGTALSQQVNTPIRQASFASSMIGQFTADNSGQDTLDDGDIARFEANFRTAIGAVAPKRNSAFFTSAGTFTWTCPAGVKVIEVEMVGGGCSGACGTSSAAGGGGGSGAYSRGYLDVTPGTVYTLVVGAGGAQQASNGSYGLAGSASSFSTLMTTPGAPSTFIILATGSPGGPAGTGGQINLPGNPGNDATPTNNLLGGSGGSSPFGSGGRAGQPIAVDGTAYGSGGGGSYGSSPGHSGAGAAGAILIRY